MIIDHVGIVVRSLEESVAHWHTAFGYHQATEPVTNTRQKVRVVFLAKLGSLPVKLIEPTDSTSSVQELAHRGGGLHHLCFRCESVDDEVERLEHLGLRTLVSPEPGEAFESEQIAFLYAGDGLIIELIDTDRQAARLRPGSAG